MRSSACTQQAARWAGAVLRGTALRTMRLDNQYPLLDLNERFQAEKPGVLGLTRRRGPIGIKI